jgi:hypothetical protein
VVEFWVKEKGWRVRGQGHKYGLYPPDPGVRVVPPFVSLGGTPSGSATWHAKRIGRACERLLEAIAERSLDIEAGEEPVDDQS